MLVQLLISVLVSCCFLLVGIIGQNILGRIEVCKVVFGGCKHFTSRKTDCLADTVRQYANASARRALTFVRIDPPTFPIPKGYYKAENYLANMSKVFKECVYGEFKADCYLVKDGMDLACLRLYLKYEPVDNYYDDD
ncbi:uncharacterized protein LOC134670573 [Cydia fagiglandana]|uniref:uncharacterized protein LOC134670573 n=1 Tax=Cydia fagiglandana TaxID=1458189 RepID=UPI002FEE2790